MDTSPSILIINSYHPGFVWTLDQTEAFQDEISSHRSSTQFFSEFLDAKRTGNRTGRLAMAELIRSKYSGRNFDLIYATDDLALQFAQTFSHVIWDKPPPIVASGINNPELLDTCLHPGTKGVIETQAGSDTISLALALQRRTNQVVVVSDGTEVGIDIADQIEAQARAVCDCPVIRMPPLNWRDSLSYIERFGPDTIFLLGIYAVDDSGMYIDPASASQEIAEHARGPVFTFIDIHLAPGGVVGGLVNRGAYQGRAAARLALRILGGESLHTIQSITVEPKIWTFSHEGLANSATRKPAFPKAASSSGSPVTSLRATPGPSQEYPPLSFFRPS